MASMLRSVKLLRYFSGFTKNIVKFIHSGERKLLRNVPATYYGLAHDYSNVAAIKNDASVDSQLRRLDNDVRRTGRITRRDIQEVLEEIRNQQTATSSQSLMLIRCCGNLVPEELPEVRTALVQEIWKTLESLNIPFDISHYNALLRVYLENEHPFSPTDLLSEIESKGIEPNRVTFQRLIARYCQQGDIEGATSILEHMREKKLPVNEHVFNSLIQGHSQANDLKSAQGILSVMKQAGLEPSADTYTALLCGYARQGDVESILRTMDECEEKEIFLLDKDVLDVAYALAISGHGDKVGAVLERLRLTIGFNQEAVNTILRLINKGYEDIGLKILRMMPRGTRADGSPNETGMFFIRQLIKANRPLENILKICKTLQDEGLNSRALHIAVETSLSNGNTNVAISLLSELKKNDQPIRPHYFWPLFCSVDSSEIMDIVHHMSDDFNLIPNAETVREYIVPNLKQKDWKKTIDLLRGVGVSLGTCYASVAYNSLINNKISTAASIMESYNAFYAPTIFRQPLLIALNKTEDFQSFIRIVRQINDNSKRLNNNRQAIASSVETDDIDSDISENNNSDVVGAIILDAIRYFKRDRVVILEKILHGLVEQGLSINNANAARIEERLGSEMTSTISELLGKMTSGELEPIPLNIENHKRTLDSLSIEEIERFIANVEEKNENANNLKRHLLQACFRSKNLDKTLQVIEKFKDENYPLPSGVYAQLIDLYCHHGKLSEALELYERMKKNDKEFILDNLKTLHICDLMIKQERYDDAVKFLEQNKRETSTTTTNNGELEYSFNYNTTCWRLLNNFADTGNAERMQEIFDALVKNNYIQPTNVLLGPLIKVHLVKDDIEKAFETFEKLCDTYQATPWKNELACRLIQKEDAKTLQKLTDISTNIHGEINSLYDLVFSFVECGRIRQARKILETPGLHTRPHRIENACKRYKDEGKVQSLEGLMEATSNLNHIDRNAIYYNLLLSYISTSDAEKALGLWTKMQEDDVPPKDDFLIKLSDLLRSKNIDVPFVIPKEQQQQQFMSNLSIETTTTTSSSSSSITEVVKKSKSSPSVGSILSKFRKAINSQDIDMALTYKNQIKSDDKDFTIYDFSRLIELLVRCGRLQEATKYVDEVFASNQYPLPKVMKFYLNKLANAGDVETMTRIGAKFSDDMKRKLSFDNRFCHANVVAGKAESYVKMLSDQIDNAKTDEEIEKAAMEFPRGGALGILEKNPEVLPEYEKLCEKFADKNHFGPINVLWVYYCLNGNEAAAKIIFDKYLMNTPRLMFERILKAGRDNKDEQLIGNLIEQLRNSKISEDAVGSAYSCLIDIQMGKQKYDEAMSTLKMAIEDVCLENINRTSLKRLESEIEAQGKSFPYKLSEKSTTKDDDRNTSGSSSGSSSSSSSSSEDEDDVTPKRPETIPKRPESLP